MDEEQIYDEYLDGDLTALQMQRGVDLALEEFALIDFEEDLPDA